MNEIEIAINQKAVPTEVLRPLEVFSHVNPIACAAATAEVCASIEAAAKETAAMWNNFWGYGPRFGSEKLAARFVQGDHSVDALIGLMVGTTAG